jgi:hypothetical protein
LKSTDATLACIARRQACWASAEPAVQDGMERRRDSFAQNMEAAAQALARISSVMASTPTSSRTAMGQLEVAAPAHRPLLTFTLEPKPPTWVQAPSRSRATSWLAVLARASGS